MAFRALPVALGIFLGLHVLAADGPQVPPKDTLPAVLPLDEIPLGLDPRSTVKDNPVTALRVKLGRRLFFDPILSADKSMACASCHQPAHGFAGPDGRPHGIGGQRLARRAPTLFNRAYGTSFFWDGRVGSLEEQAFQPIQDPTEMGSSVAEVVRRLRADPDYNAQFQKTFPDGATAANLGRALASFERVLLRGGSRIDRFRGNGEHGALTPKQRQGLWLYESKGRCWQCHKGANFTDETFHNTGVGWGTQPADLGRFGVTRKEADKGKFKTPTLRGVGMTAPYMHNGSMKSLQDVVEFYNRGGGPNANLDPALGPLGLSAEEVGSLVAFLEAL